MTEGTYSGEVNKADFDGIISCCQSSIRMNEHADNLRVLRRSVVVVAHVVVIDIPCVQTSVIRAGELVLDGVKHILADRRI